MNWKCNVKSIFAVAGALMALVVTDNVLAEGCTQDSGKASPVVNLKGVYTCADLRGADGQPRATLSAAEASWGVSTTNGSAYWTSNTNKKVTEVLVSGTNGGNTCGYTYDGTTKADSNLGYLKSTGTYQGVQGVAICTDGSELPSAKKIPNCTDFLTNNNGIDGVGITCPSSGATSIIYNFEVGKPFFNTNGTPMACVCGNGGQPLFECNPNVPAGESGACPSNTTGTKTGTEVTTHVEINNDPYVCSTVGGTRTCYYYTY